VVDLTANASPSRDLDQLVYRFEQTIALVAQMRDIRAAGSLGQRGELVGGGERARRVDERGPEAEGALGSGIASKDAHALQLVRCRRPVVVADLMNAEGGRADERRDVHRDAEPDEMVETLAEGGPRHVVLDVGLTLDLIATHRVGERPHRGPFTEHLERYALAHVALRAAVRN